MQVIVGSAMLGQVDTAPSGLWGLFVESFDLFTVLLVSGSIVAVAVIVRAVIDIRPRRIMPRESITRIELMASERRWGDLRRFVEQDGSFVSRVLRRVFESPAPDRRAIRETAELAASEESGRWFGRIDLLSVIGNLGPLLGLAGTVWGMIIAFASLGAAGGQAGPGELSEGISKALFHTLLGLLLAIPCLLVHGVYRNLIDRLCTRGMVVCSGVVERLPIERVSGAGSDAGSAQADTADPRAA